LRLSITVTSARVDPSCTAAASPPKPAPTIRMHGPDAFSLVSILALLWIRYLHAGKMTPILRSGEFHHADLLEIMGSGPQSLGRSTVKVRAATVTGPVSPRKPRRFLAQIAIGLLVMGATTARWPLSGTARHPRSISFRNSRRGAGHAGNWSSHRQRTRIFPVYSTKQQPESNRPPRAWPFPKTGCHFSG
jgi:hypothetical protein